MFSDGGEMDRDSREALDCALGPAELGLGRGLGRGQLGADQASGEQGAAATGLAGPGLPGSGPEAPRLPGERVLGSRGWAWLQPGSHQPSCGEPWLVLMARMIKGLITP